MSAEEILSGLDRLEGLINARRQTAIAGDYEVIWTPTSITGSIIKSDWAPVWALCKDIQAHFNAKPRFPTREQREAAWMRFNDLRNDAAALRDAERADFIAMSTFYRDDILSSARVLMYHPAADTFLGPFLGHETADEMKRAGIRLRELGQQLSREKHKMTREHKQECFEYLQEVRASHDIFWERYREHRERQREAAAERQADFRRRVRERISSHYVRLRNARNALDRQISHMSELRDKLDSARSPEFALRVASWMKEASNKIDDIREHISRVESWIREEEAKLN